MISWTDVVIYLIVGLIAVSGKERERRTAEWSAGTFGKIIIEKMRQNKCDWYRMPMHSRKGRTKQINRNSSNIEWQEGSLFIYITVIRLLSVISICFNDEQFPELLRERRKKIAFNHGITMILQFNVVNQLRKSQKQLSIYYDNDQCSRPHSVNMCDDDAVAVAAFSVSNILPR